MTSYFLTLTLAKKIILHTDASNTHLGGVISKNGKPITFYSLELTPAHINYTTTEKELLSIVENPKRVSYNSFRTPYNSIYGPQ